MTSTDALRALEDATRDRQEADQRRIDAVRRARQAGATYRQIAAAADLAVSHVHRIAHARA